MSINVVFSVKWLLRFYIFFTWWYRKMKHIIWVKLLFFENSLRGIFLRDQRRIIDFLALQEKSYESPMNCCTFWKTVSQIHLKVFWAFHAYRLLIISIQGGSEHTLFGGLCTLHTPSNLLNTDDRELKFYIVIDFHKLFWKIGKKFWLKVIIMHLWRHDYARMNRF